jgi:hypothetical protein
MRQFCSAVFVSLNTIASMPARETHPRILVVRKRTVLFESSLFDCDTCAKVSGELGVYESKLVL